MVCLNFYKKEKIKYHMNNYSLFVGFICECDINLRG